MSKYVIRTDSGKFIQVSFLEQHGPKFIFNWSLRPGRIVIYCASIDFVPLSDATLFDSPNSPLLKLTLEKLKQNPKFGVDFRTCKVIHSNTELELEHQYVLKCKSQYLVLAGVDTGREAYILLTNDISKATHILSRSDEIGWRSQSMIDLALKSGFLKHNIELTIVKE